MTTFFTKHDNTGYVAADFVATLEDAPERGVGVMKARLKDGGLAFVSRASVEAAPKATMPASPYIKALVVTVDGDEVHTDARPIIAWAPSGNVWFPVIAGCAPDESEEVVFFDTSAPDAIYRRGDATAASLEETLKQIKRERAFVAKRAGGAK